MRRAEATDHFDGPSVREAQVKARVVVLARAAGWMVYHRPAKWQQNGGGSGFPDLVLARHREVLFLELKTEDGKLSADQHKWHDALPNVRVIRPHNVEDGTLVRLLARPWAGWDDGGDDH